MKNSPNIARYLLPMTLALAGLMLWNVLQTSSPAQAARAATSPPGARAVANGKIAFNRDGEIFTINADGTDLKQLTVGGGSGALWSPDGTKIAFGRSSQICVMNADGSNQECPTPSGDISFSPAWSPDSTQIAFGRSIIIGVSGTGAMRRSVYKRDIYAMNADGSNQTSLTNSDPDDWVSFPFWSPDGMKIAFSRGGRYPNTVRVMNADGSNQQDILNGYSYPKAWSPDGSKLLVSPSGMKGIWVVNPDGSSLTKVHEPIPSTAYPNVGDGSPVWSPDGSKVAISTIFCDSRHCLDDFGYSVIIVVNADGSHPTQGGGGGGFVGSPTWSPDGTKIIFDEYLVANPGLFMMNADASGVTSVRNGGGGFEPSWQAVPIRPSAIDDTQFFVRQQYRDFLGREPDTIGFQNWVNTLVNCPNGGYGEFDNPGCDRVHVSAGFYLSDEFRGRGYWILRFGFVGLNRSIGSVRSSTTYAEFIPALQQIGGSNSPAQEEAAKVAYTNAFVQRSDFQALFPAGLSNSQYVNGLESNAGVTLNNKQALIDGLNNMSMTRADVLRNVVESQIVFDKFIIPSFVTMEYFGYLRRDVDEIGYQNWVDTLTADHGNYRHMIFGFIYSTEYRNRFGP